MHPCLTAHGMAPVTAYLPSLYLLLLPCSACPATILIALYFSCRQDSPCKGARRKIRDMGVCEGVGLQDLLVHMKSSTHTLHPRNLLFPFIPGFVALLAFPDCFCLLAVSSSRSFCRFRPVLSQQEAGLGSLTSDSRNK